jgi:hypothetical protein
MTDAAKEAAWRGGTGQKIVKLYAWVVQEPDGGEGILGVWSPGMPGLTPAIGAGLARVESYRDQAQYMARASGYPVRLKVFGFGVVIDEIDRARPEIAPDV